MERVRHGFGVVPADLLDDEAALKEWFRDQAAEIGLSPLLIGLRVTKTYDEQRTNVIDVTVAEGLCVLGEPRLPEVTYHDLASEHVEWPDGS